MFCVSMKHNLFFSVFFVRIDVCFSFLTATIFYIKHSSSGAWTSCGCFCWSRTATRGTWRRTWTATCARPSGRWRSRSCRTTSRTCERSCSCWWGRGQVSDDSGPRAPRCHSVLTTPPCLFHRVGNVPRQITGATPCWTPQLWTRRWTVCGTGCSTQRTPWGTPWTTTSRWTSWSRPCDSVPIRAR